MSTGMEGLGRLIGQRVRDARLARGWTLDQLAQRSGVSRRLLITVEQGASNPSIATLLRVSDALGIGLPALVDAADQTPAAVVVRRPAEQAVMWQGAAGGTAVMVAGTLPPEVTELWDWRLGPGDHHASEPHRAGTRELLHVLTGSVDLRVGAQTHHLRAGDSASFDGSLPHAYANPHASRAARFTLAVHEPLQEQR